MVTVAVGGLWILFSGIILTTLLMIFECPDVVAAAVLSGNRNFEGRVHPLTRANYLASPPLVVAYALAGTVSTFYNSPPLFCIGKRR